MNTQLFIEGQQADINGDLAMLLTLAIEDISYQNFGSRQTTFSKTIIMPGTAHNNTLLGSIFEVSVSNPYTPHAANVGLNFNPAISANCLVFQDVMQAFKGSVRVLKVNIKGGVIEYEAALTGELFFLNSALTGKYLEDLDFSIYSHTFSVSEVTNSWDNPGGTGYYYPLIDYGGYSANKHDWDIRTFRPALHVYEYMTKILTGAGFTWVAPLFETTRFKKLIIPHNQSKFQRQSDFMLNVAMTTTTHFTNASGGIQSIAFPNILVAQNFTANGTNTIFTYTAAGVLNGTIKADIGGTFIKAIANSKFTLQLYRNGSIIGTSEGGFGLTSAGLNLDITLPISINNGDAFEVKINIDNPFQSFDYTIFGGALSVQSSVVSYVDIGPGDGIDIHDAIPKGVKQLDFITSIVKLFNLYVYEDKNDSRKLYFTPYIDFYSASTLNSVDWSYKIDRGETIGITPLSEVSAKSYVFKYKDDNDYYNDVYKKRYNIAYGSHVFDTDFDFVDQIQTIELIFAPTPLVGYAGEDKVYPTILKISNNVEDRTDCVIRIMQSKKITGVTSWNIKDGATVLAGTINYGYAGHFNDPDTIDDDLNFGILEEVFFTIVSADNITVNQFNVYWSGFMAEITDKDSKMLTAKAYLSVKDIATLDFSKYIYVDGSLFRLYKINDYNMSMPDTCGIELLKVINTVY